MAPIKISAPPGFGKSTLLIRAFQLARKEGVHVVYLDQLGNLSDEGNLSALTQSIEDMRFSLRMLLPELKAGVFAMSWKEGIDVPLRTALKNKFLLGKVIFLLDDVQDYHGDSLKLLVGLVEEMMAENYPTTMIMAGLPRMDQNLAAINIGPTSWSKVFRIKRLSKEEVAEALFKTFRGHGFKVTPEALDLMVEHSGSHPHFVQIVGSVVWEASQDEKTWTINDSLVKQARASIQSNKDIAYKSYYARIKNKKLALFVKEIIQAIESSGAYMTRSGLIEALSAERQDMSVQEIADKIDVLQEMDFFWENAEQELEPSIPSIFDYIKRLK